MSIQNKRRINFRIKNVNSQSKFHSGNSSGTYFNKKNVVEFSVGRRYPKWKKRSISI